MRTNRCCGRCDGINDICVTDMECEDHNTMGCQLCHGAIQEETKPNFMKYKFWFFVHNVIAHPLLCTGKGWADRFHDWTSDKMGDH